MTTETTADARSEFRHVQHTFVLSDIHLADAVLPNPKRPLWKKYKRPEFFVDRDLQALLKEMIAKVGEQSAELVLNGDIFDFDSVQTLPSKPNFFVSFIEKRRGLGSEEPKSRFKMQVILRDHPIFVEMLRDWVSRGHRLVFVIGNHDIELHWPGVQQDLLDALRLPEDALARIRFCEFFYVSNDDTLIEHGNQHDRYCVCSDPMHPAVNLAGKVAVRLPFGNIAGKLIMNGIGLMNPHSDTSFIKSSASEYFVFFYRYVIRHEPLLPWVWITGAIATLVQSISEGLLPALKDPLMVETRAENIARKANASPRTVRLVNELRAHPAVHNPGLILQELWLDRAFLVGLILFVSAEVILHIKLVTGASFWWVIIPLVIFLPPFVFYARRVESQSHKLHAVMLKAVPLLAKAAHVNRVVQGHIHRAIHTWVDGVEHLNPGTWSPAFDDVECTKPSSKRCFVWIQPKPDSPSRFAELLEWKDGRADILMPSEVIQA